MKQIFTRKNILKKIFSFLLIFIFLGNLTCQEIDNSENLVTETEITNQENNSEQETQIISQENVDSKILEEKKNQSHGRADING